MAQEQRLHKDYLFGVLALQATISDTTLSSTVFATLPTITGTKQYLPLVLHNQATGLFEIVWVTAHAAASQTVTVVRGKEGSTQQAWPAQTQVLDAPTWRDLLIQTTFAALPADAHLGARAVATDLGTNGVVMEKTPAGWGPAVGICLGSQAGPILNSVSNPPDDAVIVNRAGYFDGTSDAGGNVTVTFRQPFANGFIGAQMASCVLNTLGPFVVISATVANMVVRCYNASTAAVNTGTVRFTYNAQGW
jgi:hypothetical protein